MAAAGVQWRIRKNGINGRNNGSGIACMLQRRKHEIAAKSAAAAKRHRRRSIMPARVLAENKSNKEKWRSVSVS